MIKKEITGKNKSLLSKTAGFVCTAAAIGMLLLLGYLLITENIAVVNSRDDMGFKTVSNYICREAESEDSPTGVKTEYIISLPDEIKHDTFFAFYTVHQYAEAYIGGELIYSLKPSKDNKIGKTVGSNWVMFPLYREDAGKELRVEITPVYRSFGSRKTEFLTGSQLEIYVHRLKRDLPQIILGAMTVLVGIIFIILATYNAIKRKKGENLAALGLFSLMMGIWRLTDTRFTPFAAPEKSVFLFYTSIAMLMIGMVPLIKSINNRFNKKSANILYSYCIVSGIVCIAQLILQVFNIMDIRENLFVTHIIIAIGALLIIANAVYDRICFPKNKSRRIGRRLPLVCVAGVMADTIAFYIWGTSSGLIFSLSAFLLYIIFSGIGILQEYNEQEKRLREQEVMLVETRIAAMIDRIQPHFIFNSLTAIKYLCKKDSEEAQEAIENFSFFLRGSIDALSLKECVPFEHELEITKNYLYLEQKRFGDKLRIEYDIKEKGFSVPALSVQPMVENAIRHGIRQKTGVGCVRISTYKDEKNYIIKISDDGVGFDAEQQNKDGKLHVGISNVENRLKLMCGGMMDISSTQGKGTEVVIKIPEK